MKTLNRRDFLRDLGLSAAALPFVTGLPGLRADSRSAAPARRLIIMFTPNGTLPDRFWPDAAGPLAELKPILQPLAAFKDRMLVLKGVANRVRGDGDNHMRGMSCLLTCRELHPGNIQGGSHTPAGWASGISIDQEVRNRFQEREETRTRFGSLEFGVAVPHRADPWTRMSYAGSNKPVAPIDDPYQMLQKLYGHVKDKESLTGILDHVGEDLKRVSSKLEASDRALLEEHMTLVREMERELEAAGDEDAARHPEPELDPGVELVNDNTPRISRMQIDLLVNSLANDMARVATLQFMRSVGQARMNWLGIEDGHHTLSHKPDNDAESTDKLHRINSWFAGELAHLAKRLADTPEPGGDGNMLDHTQIVWVNELGKGNNHTLDDIPFVLIGGGCGFNTGRSFDFGHKKQKEGDKQKEAGKPDPVAHNRLWLAVANGLGHDLQTFGKKEFCEGGALSI